MNAGEVLWAWALAAYDRPGVPEACLALQDDHGQQTAFLLWAAWADPGPAPLEQGAALARRWEGEVLGPLRTARRNMKPPMANMDEADRMALREEVKAIELSAERLLMISLAALASPGAGAEARHGLTAAARAWGDPPPPAALESLLEALA